MTVYFGVDTALGPDRSCAVSFRRNPDGTLTMIDHREISNPSPKRIEMVRGPDGVWQEKQS